MKISSTHALPCLFWKFVSFYESMKQFLFYYLFINSKQYLFILSMDQNASIKIIEIGFNISQIMFGRGDRKPRGIINERFSCFEYSITFKTQ